MRQVYNVLVLLYKKEANEIKYAVFKRADGDIYQGIAGGVEENETYLCAAIREVQEETSLAINDLIELDSTASVPAIFFPELSDIKGLYVVKELSYGAEVHQDKIQLSHEHTSYEWMSYDEAYRRFTFDSNRVALWELNERLKNEDY